MNPRTADTWALKNGKVGQSFLSFQPDKNITALATHYGRKITTERMVAVTLIQRPEATAITKFTIIE